MNRLPRSNARLARELLHEAQNLDVERLLQRLLDLTSNVPLAPPSAAHLAELLREAAQRLAP
jgi:hypothetical protein